MYTHGIGFGSAYNPAYAEYQGGISSTKTLTLSSTNGIAPGSHEQYRFIKVPKSSFNIDYLRATAGL